MEMKSIQMRISGLAPGLDRQTMIPRGLKARIQGYPRGYEHTLLRQLRIAFSPKTSQEAESCFIGRIYFALKKTGARTVEELLVEVEREMIGARMMVGVPFYQITEVSHVRPTTALGARFVVTVETVDALSQQTQQMSAAAKYLERFGSLG
jgi:hypothetical protein